VTSSTDSASPATSGHASGSPAEVVQTFLVALADGDFDTAFDLVDDDIVYQNVSLPTIRGKRWMAAGARKFAQRGLGFDVKIHRICETGTSVLTERTDAIMLGSYRSQFWVCGAFEVSDGKITLWRDYFDWAAILAASVRGLVATVIPSLRARLD
jgi:limonene-1,2-epoxide hydrolase